MKIRSSRPVLRYPCHSYFCTLFLPLRCNFSCLRVICLISCAGRNCVDSLERNQPANYKSAIGTVNHESDLLMNCEISLRVYVLIWQMNYASLSLQFRLAISDNQ